jgi:hypothetical protein
MRNGKHLGGFKYRNRRNVNRTERSTLLGTLITAIAGTVVKDLTNENSKIKFLFNKMFHSKQIEDKQKQDDVIEAEYSVLNGELLDQNNIKSIERNGK